MVSDSGSPWNGNIGGGRIVCCGRDVLHDLDLARVLKICSTISRLHNKQYNSFTALQAGVSMGASCSSIVVSSYTPSPEVHSGEGGRHPDVRHCCVVVLCNVNNKLSLVRT